MLIVVKKDSSPLKHYAINETEAENYPKEEWVHNPASLKGLLDSNVPDRYLKTVGDDVVEMTQQEKDDYDNSKLADLKAARFVEIDTKTSALIGEGFVFQDKTFSLSSQAQNNMLGVKAAIADHRASGSIVAFEAAFFPITFNTLDDNDTVKLVTVDDYESFYDTGMSVVRTHLDGGTALKSAIRAAATKAELDAIVDNR